MPVGELGGRKPVTLEVAECISIGFGIVLSPGLYPGWSTRYWLGTQYFIELTKEEVKLLGGDPATGTFIYDVSRWVRNGKIGAF